MVDGSRVSAADLTRMVLDPRECEHEWQPVSMVFETQLLDSEGRVRVRQPDLDAGRVYLVCVGCASHTYMATSWINYRLHGSDDRSVDPDAPFRPVEPTERETTGG